MAGGAGTRFWPVSTRSRPKQFLRLLGDHSLLQQSYDRAQLLTDPQHVLVMTNAEFVPMVREQLPDLPSENVVGEPLRRDTAAAVALAAFVARARFGSPVMVVLTADHLIEPPEEFRRAMRSAIAAAAPFAPRCLKDVVEERLFAHRRDLLTRLDLVFMDTTSLYFEGAGGQTLGQHGYSKDHRPDLRQMILAVLIDGDGRPVCSEMWPGNTADVTTLIPVIDRLRRRFHIARVCVVADRGMISAETIAELEARRLLYILGVRERSDKLVRELVLDDPAPFVPLAMKKRSKEIDYEAKTVMLAGRRYIVCRNQQEAQKDAADRASIVAALERQLAKGDKALVGNTGFRRYLKTISDEHFAIDPDKIEEERKFDGIFVLRTNTDLNPLEAMLCYKQLWTVEQTFRTAKHLFSTRPIFHKLDETIRGHVFCSFLALVLKTALEDRIAALGRSGSWPEIIADLDSLTETEIEHDGKRFIVRSAPRPAASLALRAAGIALPPTVREAAAS